MERVCSERNVQPSGEGGGVALVKTLTERFKPLAYKRQDKIEKKVVALSEKSTAMIQHE